MGAPLSADADLDDLPAAREEPAVIAKIFSAETATGRAATIERLIGAAEKKTFFHYSGHFVTPRLRTEPSWLQFGPSEAAPTGKVPLRQIASLRLSHLQLVFLSACSSVNAGTSELAGSFGPALAFLKAGVPDVMGNLWAVPDDEELEIARGFYERLRGSASPRAALQDLWRSEAGASPSRRAALAALSLASISPTGGTSQ
jgi:CHAT domain-containing protein